MDWVEIMKPFKTKIMTKRVAHHFGDTSKLIQLLNFMEMEKMINCKMFCLKLELLYMMMVGLMVMELN